MAMGAVLGTALGVDMALVMAGSGRCRGVYYPCHTVPWNVAGFPRSLMGWLNYPAVTDDQPCRARGHGAQPGGCEFAQAGDAATLFCVSWPAANQTGRGPIASRG